MDQKTNRKQNPSEFLRQIIGKPVVVKLNSGVDYRGILACLDGYMNIALEQTEEYVNGQVMFWVTTIIRGVVKSCTIYTVVILGRPKVTILILQYYQFHSRRFSLGRFDIRGSALDYEHWAWVEPH